MKTRLNCVELSPWVHELLSYKYDKIDIFIKSSGRSSGYFFSIFYSNSIFLYFFSSYFVYHVLEKLITKYFSYVREKNTSGYLQFPFGLSVSLYSGNFLWL